MRDAATYAFGPRERAGHPRIALVEAGTGIGKTLGYLAPASLWAEKNGPGLWISTYTRNLQRQIVQEIARLYPDPAERAEKAVVRKGRENYLCLLNFEEAAKRIALAPGQRSGRARPHRALGRRRPRTAIFRARAFPPFSARRFRLRELTDRRGECIYAACPHYRTCFIERAIRRARHAPIVVANHALVIATRRARLAERRRNHRRAAGKAAALCVRRRPSSVRRGGFGFRRAAFGPRNGRSAALDPRARRRAAQAACAGLEERLQGPRRRR